MGFAPASQIVVKIGTNALNGIVQGVNQILNPISVGSYKETIILNNTAPGETGEVSIPIVDSDTIDVTGFVTAYMHFDIDTATGETPGPEIDGSDNTIMDCAYSGIGACLTHSSGEAGSNYTVDFGELSSAIVNKSNSISVVHSDGADGVINSIYFDISTNAISGAVVMVKSANGGLQGPGTNKILSVGEVGASRIDGQNISANDGVYGYNLPVASSQLHGTIIKNSLCDSTAKFCGPSITQKEVFTTGGLPVDTARVRLDLAAAASYTNNPGTYTDTLTFFATATF
jgi:hypothetical protein